MRHVRIAPAVGLLGTAALALTGCFGGGSSSSGGASGKGSATYSVFRMARCFRAIARGIRRAASLDGASMTRSYWSIGLSMIGNAIFTVGLVKFLLLWNDLRVARTFTNSQDLGTIQVGVRNFTLNGPTAYGPLFAAICVSVFGTLIVDLVLDQRILAGFTAGALKG